MAIKVSQAFERTSREPIDVTLTLTKAQMLLVEDSMMPDKYFTVCQDDGKLYLYDKTATPSLETGKFSVFEGGSGVELTQAEYDALTPEQKLDGTVYFVTDGQGGGGGTDLPSGGTTGQVLAKKSNVDGDVEWKNVGGGGDSSVQLTPDTSKKEIAVSDDNGNNLTVSLNDGGKIKLRTESPMLFGVDKYLQEEAVIFDVNSTVYSYDDFYDVINNHKAAYIAGYDSIETVLYIECYMDGAVIYSTNGWAIKTYYWSSDESDDHRLKLPQTRNIAFSNDIFKTYRLGPSNKYNFNDVYNDTINLNRVVYITTSQGNKILISSTRHEGTLGTANSAIVCYGTDGTTIYTFRMAQNLDPDDNTSYFTETTRDANVITAPNGDMFRIKVANDGTLSTEKVV